MSIYAPEYTKKEFIDTFIEMFTWFIPLVVATELWFFDWLAEYSTNANC